MHTTGRKEKVFKVNRRVKKIVLIEPKASSHHVFQNFLFPRLGLLQIGTILKRKGYKVSIYCESISGVEMKESLSADLVGISTITCTAPGAYRFAKFFTERGIPTVIGGVHATFLPDEVLEYAPFCVRGEGEETMLELVQALEEGEFEHIKGLSYRWDGKSIHNSERPPIKDLDSLPFPDFSLLKKAERLSFFPVSTSRGCPFSCKFCSVSKMFGRGYRFRSIESVKEELTRVKEGRFVFFCDDNFSANRERTKLLMDALLKDGLRIKWSAQVRVDVAKDVELLKLMKRAGCKVLYIGFESINPATLKDFDKRQSIEEIKEAIHRIKEVGIKVHGMFVFGSDADDEGTIKKTLHFAKRTQMETVQFLILTPIPGSLIYEEFLRGKRIFTKEWSFYDGHHVVFLPKRLTPYTLQTETVKAMRSFYSIKDAVKRLLRKDILTFFQRIFANILIRRWQKAKTQFVQSLKKL